ncbi:MAG: hypothetical protein M1829_004745 [Trizodia sp. TS-e1964]|nr:MAG: hypothetical protein M1829_004745 [Trizodia sp. TS-e1964]
MPVIIAPGFAGNVISIEDSDSEVSDDVLEVLARLPDTQQDHPARVAPHPNAKSEVERQANCSRDVREVFPDICLDYLAELYQLVGAQDPAPAQTIIDKILGGESYPKEKEKLNLLKRKRSEDDEEKRANDLASHFSGQDRDIYSRDGTGRA